MDITRAEWISRRARRALSLIALAMIVVVAASLIYLWPSLSAKPKTASPATILPPVSRPSEDIAYDFATPSMGWALVVRPAPAIGPGNFWVFRTTDAARHWQQQFAGQTGTGGLGPQSVRFFDKANGLIWLAGSTDVVYRTGDGGAHWHSVALPGPQSGLVTFADPGHGWLFVSTGTPTDQAANLYRTDDAGNTWRRLPDPPLDVAGTVVFRRLSEGWSGSRRSSDPVPHVYSSTDGGITWVRHDLPLPSAGLPAGTTASLRLLPGRGVMALLDAGDGQPYALTSFDNGTSWKYVQARPSRISFSDVLGFQDAVHWWAIDGSTLYKSSDAGQTWKPISDQLNGAYLYVPYILDSQHAWAQVFDTVGTGLAVTADGGLNWTRAPVPQPA